MAVGKETGVSVVRVGGAVVATTTSPGTRGVARAAGAVVSAPARAPARDRDTDETLIGADPDATPLRGGAGMPDVRVVRAVGTGVATGACVVAGPVWVTGA